MGVVHPDEKANLSYYNFLSHMYYNTLVYSLCPSTIDC